MIRGREIGLYRQLSSWKSSATQTQFGIFWSLNFQWALSIGLWGATRREEKLTVRQAVGKWQIQIEGKELFPLNCLKGQPKGKSTKKLAWKFKQDHCVMSKTLKEKGPSICARKTRHTHTHALTAVATTESTLLDAEFETFAPKGQWCRHTKCAPTSSKRKYLVVGVAGSV